MSLPTITTHLTSFAHAGHTHTPEETFTAVLIGVFALVFLAAYAITAYLLSRIFKKAGVAAWKAWVPVYSTWVTLELGGQKGWWALLYLAGYITWLPLGLNESGMIVLTLVTLVLSLVASVFLYIAMYKIGLRFGKEGYFVLWAIFLPIVWYAWLAFDESTWKKSSEAIDFNSEAPIKE